MENLTIEQVENAIVEIPAHRKEVQRGLQSILALIRRGISVKDNAPVWKQAQNVIFARQFEDENGKADLPLTDNRKKSGVRRQDSD